jgi:hypothetical protein
VAFVTLGGEASYTARCHPRTPKRVMSLEKVCEGLLYLQKEKSKRLVEWEKWLKEIRLGVCLMSNSSFLNRNVGITGSNFEL